jgi:hypothetical protein
MSRRFEEDLAVREKRGAWRQPCVTPDAPKQIDSSENGGRGFVGLK